MDVRWICFCIAFDESQTQFLGVDCGWVILYGRMINFSNFLHDWWLLHSICIVDMTFKPSLPFPGGQVVKLDHPSSSSTICIFFFTLILKILNTFIVTIRIRETGNYIIVWNITMIKTGHGSVNRWTMGPLGHLFASLTLDMIYATLHWLAKVSVS